MLAISVRITVAIATTVLSSTRCLANLEVFTFDAGNVTIPDNSLSGITDSHSIPDHGYIQSMTVNIRLDGAAGENGDVYAYLQHGSSIAVLLNRVGRDTSQPGGYADAGFDITLDDQAENGDIHVYRETIFGSGTQPLGGALTDASFGGYWAPDGRATLPTNVTTQDPRTKLLAEFTGSDIAGPWTLFVADASPGHTLKLKQWSLSLTTVPEPRAMPMLMGLFLLGWGIRRRCLERQ